MDHQKMRETIAEAKRLSRELFARNYDPRWPFDYRAEAVARELGAKALDMEWQLDAIEGKIVVDLASGMIRRR